jgi:Tfp pilus assembly protein PilO
MSKLPDYRIFAGITAFLALGGTALMFSQFSTLSAEQEKAESLKKDIKNEAELKRMLVDSMAKLQSTRERLAHLEKGVPDYAYLATMLKELAVVGKESGITILGVSQKPHVSAPKEGEVKEKKAYIEQDIEVLGKGQYADALRFMKSLNKFPKVVAARTVVIQPKTSAHDEHALDITINLRTFLFPEKAKTPNTTTAMNKSEAKHEG